MEEKIEKIFFVFQILAFELGVANSGNIEQDTCDCQPMCQQTPLRFNLTLRKIFSKSTSLKFTKKYDKSTLIDISQVFGNLSHLNCLSVFGNGASYRVV